MVGKMVKENNLPARPADAAHFRNDLLRKWYGGHDIGGHHRIEGVVRELDGGRIHLEEFDMPEVQPADSVSTLLKHRAGQVDARHAAIPRVERKGQSGTDAYFEDMVFRLDLQISKCIDPGFMKDLAERQVVKL